MTPRYTQLKNKVDTVICCAVSRNYFINIILNYLYYLFHWEFAIIIVSFLTLLLLTLIWVCVSGGIFILCWFSYNKSETVKVENLVFCSIK